MIAAGIDVGTETTKVVILNNNKIASWHLLAGGDENAALSGEKALSEAAQKAGIKLADIQKLAATGLPDIQFSFVNEQVPEAMCIAKGIEWLLPSTRTVLDLGAGKSLAVKCNQGKPLKIARNDKCASGTGKYLDIVGKILGIGHDEMAELFFQSKESVEIQSTCAVFVESEVISLLHVKSRPEDIARGALRGLVKRIYPLLIEVGLEREVALVGGLARNKGVVAAFEELMGHELIVPPEPQIVAALGAALITREKAAA